jgi:hypothetical protein
MSHNDEARRWERRASGLNVFDQEERPDTASPKPLPQRPAYGPWTPGIDAIERAARLRALHALCRVFAPGSFELYAALRAGETDDAALAHAGALFERVASIPQRRALATLALVTGRASR